LFNLLNPEPDPDSLEMLDPDQDSKNPDPQLLPSCFQWVCPVCNKPALNDNLMVDGFFMELVK
jgi:hypothetical protein